MKACNKCGLSKPVSEFYGRRSECKPCILASRRERYLTDPAMRERLISNARQRYVPSAKPKGRTYGSPCIDCGSSDTLWWVTRSASYAKMSVAYRRCHSCFLARRPYVPVAPTLRNCSICDASFLGKGVRVTCSDRCRAIRQARWDSRTVKPKAAHHRGSFQVRSKAVRDAANASESTQCWRCLRTLAEHAPHRDGKPARWTAGHVNDGEVDGELAPEASTCNMSAGGKLKHLRSKAVV